MITSNTIYRQRAFGNIFLIMYKKNTPFKSPISCGFKPTFRTISLFYGDLIISPNKVSKINALRIKYPLFHIFTLLLICIYLYIKRFISIYLNITKHKKRIPSSAKRFRLFSVLLKNIKIDLFLYKPECYYSQSYNSCNSQDFHSFTTMRF